MKKNIKMYNVFKRINFIFEQLSWKEYSIRYWEIILGIWLFLYHQFL